MIYGSRINLEDILICPSQNDFKLKVYSEEEINTMSINVMLKLSKTKNEEKRKLLLRIIDDFRTLKYTGL
jgi:uncharacterized protein YbaR (Trm112 family)